MKLCSKPPGKCAWERRKAPLGDRRMDRRRRVSEYGMRLVEKQKAKIIYGLQERQFRNYYNKASRGTENTGETLLQLLESRLDNVVFRLGFADSRAQARQTVGHGHIEVNGQKVNIPSYAVKANDKIAWRSRSKETALFKSLGEGMGQSVIVPTWLGVNREAGEGEVLTDPELNQLENDIDTRRIVEFYSRK